MYQTLYRKYRPSSFSDVMGQDIIIKTLKNSIKNNKISHAYLFIGPRGTGKTSTAKIFARAVNCLDNFNGDICDKCDSCNVSKNNECLDIIEIDAASNNGVDEIRSLREKVALVPSELKYKVYIIDEVHMLTIQAFNALLKTLEEPPEHIIFILATTDPQKVPETIVSRCQCFNFSRISEENIVDNLLMIVNKENIDIDVEVLKQIAMVSDGGMRDSIGMLDKLSSYSDAKIVLEDFLKLNGMVLNSDLEKLVKFIYDGEIALIIQLLDSWNACGKSLVQIMIQLLNYLKEMIVSFYVDDMDIDVNFYQKLANLINEKMFDVKKSSDPKIYIEIMLLSFINDNHGIDNDNSKIISREIISDEEEVVDKTNNKNVNSFSNIENSNKAVTCETDDFFDSTSDYKNNEVLPVNIKEIMNIRVNNAFVSATKEELNCDRDSFNRLNDYTFDQQIGYLVCALLDGKLRLSSKQYLVISYEYESVVLDNLLNVVSMMDVLKKILNIDKKIAIVSDSDWNIEAKKFVENKKNNIVYELKNEPEPMFDSEKSSKNKVNNNSASDIFGDIVEVY